jgi:hypothetical protein
MALTTPKKVGHAIGLVIGLDFLTTLYAESHGDEPSPAAALVVIVVLMLLVIGLLLWSLIAVNPLARRIAAVILVLNGLLAVPGLFVSDVSTWLRVDAGLNIVGTIAAIVLMFYPDRRAVVAA